MSKSDFASQPDFDKNPDKFRGLLLRVGPGPNAGHIVHRFPGDESGSPLGLALLERVRERLATGEPLHIPEDSVLIEIGDDGVVEYEHSTTQDRTPIPATCAQTVAVLNQFNNKEEK